MKKKKKNPALIIIFIIALIIFLFAVIKLGTVYFRYQKEDSVYKNLEHYAAVDTALPENEKKHRIHICIAGCFFLSSGDQPGYGRMDLF